MRKSHLALAAACATIIIVVLPTVSLAGEVSWISGAGGPQSWEVEASNPTTSDGAVFSGPTAVYPNMCTAESKFGGKPTIKVDHANKKIELTFVPPPSKGCAQPWQPVCGLKGSFGQLEAGQWQFFSNRAGVSFSIAFTVSRELAASIYYVDVTAEGKNDGTSWADAFKCLQDALAAARSDCEIRVAQGVYQPDSGTGTVPGDPNAAFHLRTGVTIRGGYAGFQGANPDIRDMELYETVLSGDLQRNDAALTKLCDLLSHPSRADNSCHVIVGDGPDARAVLDGLTVYGGNANGSREPDRYSCGGGIYSSDDSNLTITNCVFIGNAGRYYGGAIYNGIRSVAKLTNCTITENWAGEGGVVFSDWYGKVTLAGCTVGGNSAKYRGGAVWCYPKSKLVLSNCLLSGNSAIDPLAGTGGALCCFAGTVEVSNCTLVGNLTRSGSALACYSSWLRDEQSEMRIANSILWNAGDEISNDDISSVSATYSSVEGGWPGQGNTAADPCFVEAGHWDSAGTPADPYDDFWVDGDYRPCGYSPCIDAGDPNYAPEPNATDIDGHPRVDGLAVDMGAWEMNDDPPVADAGHDQVGFALGGGTARITLDGSGSHGKEGMPLRYTWFRDGREAAQGINPVIELAPGYYIFELVVNDGRRDSEPDKVAVAVASVAGAALTIRPDKITRGSGTSKIIATVVLPEGFTKKDVDAGQRLILYPGAVRAIGQTVVGWFGKKTLVIAPFDRSELLKALPEKGVAELQVLGQLKNGRYFWASDTVIIK